MGSRSTSPTGFLLKATSRVNYLYRILLTDATARASLERRLMQSWAASSRRMHDELETLQTQLRIGSGSATSA